MSSPNDTSMQWDYHLLPLPKDRAEKSIEDALNELGRGEWELVSFYESEQRRVFVLKRPAAQ
jgi:hypothetical protein